MAVQALGVGGKTAHSWCVAGADEKEGPPPPLQDASLLHREVQKDSPWLRIEVPVGSVEHSPSLLGRGHLVRLLQGPGRLLGAPASRWHELPLQDQQKRCSIQVFGFLPHLVPSAPLQPFTPLRPTRLLRALGIGLEEGLGRQGLPGKAGVTVGAAAGFSGLMIHEGVQLGPFWAVLCFGGL